MLHDHGMTEQPFSVSTRRPAQAKVRRHQRQHFLRVVTVIATVVTCLFVGAPTQSLAQTIEQVGPPQDSPATPTPTPVVTPMPASAPTAGPTAGPSERPRPEQEANEHPGTTVAGEITAGTNHVCARLAGGAVRCWGNSGNGQLGLGNTTTIGDDESPTTNVNLGGTTATAITAGGIHTCALLTGAAVRCWGDNFRGSSASPTPSPSATTKTRPRMSTSAPRQRPSPPATSHTCALLTGGAVRCWG